MSDHVARVELLLYFMMACAIAGESFLLNAPRPHSTLPSRSGFDGGCLRSQITCCNIFGVRMTTADFSTQQQQQPQAPFDLISVEGDSSVTTGDPKVVSGASKWWSDVTEDGTFLVIRHPSTQDLKSLGMGSWVGRKGLALTLVAFQQDEADGDELSIRGSPLVGAVVEVLEGIGGSSVATRVCLLHHRKTTGVAEGVVHTLLHETIAQFLNGGSRINQLRVDVDEDSLASADRFYARHGFVRAAPGEGGREHDGDGDGDGNGHGHGEDEYEGGGDRHSATGQVRLVGERSAALKAVREVLAESESRETRGCGGGGAVMMNLLARLLHDARDIDGAVDAYLKGLEVDPSRSELFRGLGGAYQSQGQHQMAFASYQQAINLAPTDFLAYLKLGMLYEELAAGKYEEASEHAIRCFEYYLQHSGSQDTDILIRLGNLQVRRLDPAGAVRTYKKALSVDPLLSNVWFNMANAYLTLGHEEEAANCLRERTKLDGDAGVSTKYLLASLESNAEGLTDEDQVGHARELFDYYATTYDDHMRKKLLYTAPRLLQQNMKDVYNATFQAFSQEVRSAHDGDVLSYLNGSLDILDLGCGTGLVGSWLKDYAKRLVGVDVSRTMLDMATKKGCYDELRESDLRRYLAASSESDFDVVVAAETLQYLGALDTVFRDTFRVMKAGGLFAFTIDRLDDAHDPDGQGDASHEYEQESSQKQQLITVEDLDSPGLSSKGYLLRSGGTYAYSRSYLQDVAKRCGFEIVILNRHSTRLERGEPNPGYLALLRRPS